MGKIVAKVLNLSTVDFIILMQVQMLVRFVVVTAVIFVLRLMKAITHVAVQRIIH